MVRHVYFQQFNEDYQNLTKYSLIEDLGIKELTDREIENLPDRLAALPVLRFNELKRRLVEIKKPLHIHSLQHCSHCISGRGSIMDPLSGIYPVENT